MFPCTTQSKFTPVTGHEGQLQMEVGYVYYYYYYFLLAPTLFLLRRYVCNCYHTYQLRQVNSSVNSLHVIKGMLILSFLKRHKITCHREALSFLLTIRLPVKLWFCISDYAVFWVFKKFGMCSLKKLSSKGEFRENRFSDTLCKGVNEFMPYYPYFLTDLGEIRCRMSPGSDTQW